MPAGQEIVELQTAGVEQAVDGTPGGDDEGQGRHEMCGVLEQTRTLAQGVPDETQVALAQIAHSAVNQLGAPRGGAGGEIAGFHE